MLLREALGSTHLLERPQMILGIVVFRETSCRRRTVFKRLFSIQMILQRLLESVQTARSLNRQSGGSGHFVHRGVQEERVELLLEILVGDRRRVKMTTGSASDTGRAVA